ncbi:hypothetical protein RI129_001184 [Pyrocoelia pectoralis]|uniref:YqaJ viral recombinase domain-containing protein n=1 Tax=Pyrocoelia pectoralis TaxID=417401 RepID=A0AAN7VJ90_9COLE
MLQGFQKADSRNLPRVNVEMVYEFLANNANLNEPQSSGVKVVRSGREDYGDSAVGYVQVKRDGDMCTVQGRICPEHKVRAKPYTVKCFLNEKDRLIEKVDCMDCAASAGGCKHSVAFLMWLHRRSEEPAPTAVSCYWKKAVLAQVGTNIKFLKAESIGKPLKKPKVRIPPTAGFLQEIVAMTRRHNNFCPLFNHNNLPIGAKLLSIHNLMTTFIAETDDHSSDNFITFCSNILTQENIAHASSLTQTQSENSLWYELRYGRITASKLYDASVCKTVSGSLVNQVMGKLVLKELEKVLETQIQNCGFTILKNAAILGASPDGITDDAVIEIKCPMSDKTVSNYIMQNGEIHKKYLAQINLQMHATNRTKGVFCVAHPDFENSKKFTKVVVDYDSEFTKHLMDCAVQFWKNNVFPKLYHSCKLSQS